MSVQKPPFNYAPATCANCKGTGKESAYKRCRPCDTLGSVLVEQPATPCYYCRGTGRTSFEPHCAICGGSGWANVWKG